jgi:chemotaxis signal transduction protein
MTDSTEALRTRLSQLKHVFDSSFGAALATRSEQMEDLLAIGIASHPFALRARELSGVCVERSITPVPSSPPELVGLAAVRGELVAVYDLAALLGYPRTDNPRFLALGRSRSLAFAFDTLDGHISVARASISPTDGAREAWFVEMVREPDRTRPILELAVLTASLEERLRLASSTENDS